MENLFCKYYENGQITVEDRNGNSLGFRHIDHTAINKDHLDMLNGVFEQRYTVMAILHLPDKSPHTIPTMNLITGLLLKLNIKEYANVYITPSGMITYLKLPPSDSRVIKFFDSFVVVMAVPEQGRNELCKCLSGKKYKNCCMNLASK